MGIDDPGNLWWQDVLENGASSPQASYFDIDWTPPKAALQGKVLLAVLGDTFGKVLEQQQLQLIYQDHAFLIRCHERRLPTDHRTWVPLLKRVVEHLSPVLAAEEPRRMELESVVTALEHLPPRTDTSIEAVQIRYREKEIAQRRLAALVDASPEIRAALIEMLEEYNGKLGDRRSFDLLEAFLDEQPYRLCFWRVATDEINYRRFFDVDSMAAIRVEDPGGVSSGPCRRVPLHRAGLGDRFARRPLRRAVGPAGLFGTTQPVRGRSASRLYRRDSDGQSRPGRKVALPGRRKNSEPR